MNWIAHLGAKFGIAKAKKLKVNVVRYADDFVITGDSKEVLESEVRPWVEAFLAVRGLQLSEEKTRITHIDDGFDFLGWNFRKYSGKLLIKPSKKNAQAFYRKVAETISGNKTVKQGDLIRLLNPMLRGWAQYHRPVVGQAGVQPHGASGFSETLAVVEAAASAKERRVGETEVFPLSRCSAVGVRCSVRFGKTAVRG